MPRAHLTDAHVDRLVDGTKLGGIRHDGANLAAARDYLAGRCRTMAEAAARHGVLRQSVLRTAQQLRALASAEASLAQCARVAVLLPPRHVEALAAWVGRRGGEVIQ